MAGKKRRFALFSFPRILANRFERPPKWRNKNNGEAAEKFCQKNFVAQK